MGSVTLTGNARGAELGTNTIAGQVILTANGGPLRWSQRTPSPARCPARPTAPTRRINGQPNTVNGPASGQCARRARLAASSSQGWAGGAGCRPAHPCGLRRTLSALMRSAPKYLSGGLRRALAGQTGSGRPLASERFAASETSSASRAWPRALAPAAGPVRGTRRSRRSPAPRGRWARPARCASRRRPGTRAARAPTTRRRCFPRPRPGPPRTRTRRRPARRGRGCCSRTGTSAACACCPRRSRRHRRTRPAHARDPAPARSRTRCAVRRAAGSAGRSRGSSDRQQSPRTAPGRRASRPSRPAGRGAGPRRARGRPSSPDSTMRASSTYSGQNRSTRPTISIRPLRSAAARIASASSTRERERLLDEHVLPGREGALGDLAMERCRHADVDRLDLRVGEDRVEVDRRLGAHGRGDTRGPLGAPPGKPPSPVRARRAQRSSPACAEPMKPAPTIAT